MVTLSKETRTASLAIVLIVIFLTSVLCLSPIPLNYRVWGRAPSLFIYVAGRLFKHIVLQ